MIGGKVEIQTGTQVIEGFLTSMEYSVSRDEGLFGHFGVENTEMTLVLNPTVFRNLMEGTGFNMSKDLPARIADLNLSEDDKLLQEFNVVDTQGVLTATGQEVLLNIIFSQYKDEVVKKLKELKEEESK